MPVTLRDIANEPSLGLTAHASEAALDRPVAWVHTTELGDPTPFLGGGELLLTTGLALRPGDCAAFVERLAAAGVAGLGFGVGLSHETIPAPLAAAARRADLPLLQVPRPTPFIAISKEVSRRLAAEEYAALRRTSHAQHELAGAAGRPDGLAALTRKLAGLLDAWVLLLDPAGLPMQAVPASAEATHLRLRAEIERLRGKRGLAVSTSELDGQEVSMHALGARARGFLAAGRTTALSTTEHHVLNTAASLLTLALQQRHELADARRRMRCGAFELLLSGQTEPARQVLHAAGAQLPGEPLCVLAISGAQDPDTLLEWLEAEPGRPAEPVVLAIHAGQVVAMTAVGGRAVDWLAGLPARQERLAVGMSEPCGAGEFAKGHRQAVDALRHPGTGRVVRFGELGGQGLLRLVPEGDAAAFADSLLAPLSGHDANARGELVSSVREWLAQHGQWDPAATRLGVHRHTLRNRIHKVQRLLGRDLDDPGTRAELWLALQVAGGRR